MAEDFKTKTKSPLIGAQAKPTTLDKTTKLDIDTNKVLIDNIIDAGISGGLDTGLLEDFTSISNSRDQMYQLIDTMAADSSVSSIIRTYTEDVCETADNGHIVWCESTDPKISKFINYLLNVANVDKNIYSWVYNLIKYGDTYIRLFRESDYKDPIFKKDNIDIANDISAGYKTRRLTESIDLDETVNLNVHKVGDQYSYYMEMVADPGTMFELTKYGKTYGFVETPNQEHGMDYLNNYLGNNNSALPFANYKMKTNDVNIYQADDFVHACLDDNFTRYPEKVDIFLTDEDLKNNTNSTSYSVRRGKSLLYDSYKIWREKALLENAALLNRVTRSSIVRNIQVEVGDMPKSQVQNTLRRIKELFEQKSAINTGNSMAEYNSPGPIENNIFTATHGGQGAITVNAIGGDFDPKQLTDLDWWNKKFYAAYGIPPQFFGWCLGKDTEILLLDGTTHTIEELYNNRGKFIGKGIMGCNSDGSLCPTKIKNITLTNEHAELLRVWLDNGKYVDVTPDHRMMLRDGTFIEAQYLKENDSLMPFYTGIYTDSQRAGRRWVLDNKSGKRRLQFHVVAEKKFGSLKPGHQIHHGPDNKPDKLNDDFDNLSELTVPEHMAKHVKMMHAIEAQRKAERLAKGEAVNANVGGKLARSYQLYIKSNFDENTYEQNRLHGEDRPDTYLKYETLEQKLDTLNAYVPEVNHKVVKVEKLSLDNKVYDITVTDECHTFALACGIFVHNCDDGAGFNGGTSLAIISSFYSKGVKRVQNSILQALTDAINLFLVNKGCKSYLNNFVLKMKTPLSQEEKDYREDLSNRINAISSMQSLFTDVEDKARRLEILKNLVGTLNYGDGLIQEIDKEIEAVEAAKKKEEEQAAADAAAEAELEASEVAEKEVPELELPTKEESEEEPTLGMASVATTEESFTSNGGSMSLVEGPDFDNDNEELPTPEQANEGIDFTENK